MTDVFKQIEELLIKNKVPRVEVMNFAERLKVVAMIETITDEVIDKMGGNKNG